MGGRRNLTQVGRAVRAIGGARFGATPLLFATCCAFVAVGAVPRLNATAPQAVGGVPAPDHTWFYYFFDQRRPLSLDAGHIAVRWAATTDNDSFGASSLAPFAARVDEIEPLPMHGWARVTVATDPGDPEAIEKLVAEFAISPGVDFASPLFMTESGDTVVITPVLLVGFHGWVSSEVAIKVLDTQQAGDLLDSSWSNMPGVFRLQHNSRNGFDVLRAANQLAERPEVRFAESDVIFSGTGSLVPNDPYFPLSWEFRNVGQEGGMPDADMDAVEAWDVTTGAANVIVAVLDTGVEQTHADLNLIPGVDTTDEGPGSGGPVNPFDNHGTSVAGCISGIINNGIGTTGIAPDCKVASARTFIGVDDEGRWMSQPSWTVDALDWAESIGIRITNNSNAYGFTSSAIAQKYAQTRDNGMIHFASAHNDSASLLTYPAILPTVQALAAMNRFGERSKFSNYGPGLDFMAPGEEILTTDRTGTTGWVIGDWVIASGTSFASPLTGGVAALVLTRNPGLRASTVEQILRDSCVDLGAPGYDTEFGWGVVNARNAVDLAADNVPGACCVSGFCLGEMTALGCDSFGAGKPGQRWFALRSCGDVECPPAHTQCDRALEMHVNSSVTFDNGALTSLPDPHYTCGIEQFHDGALWYKFTASGTTARVHTCKSAARDSTLAVYDSCGAKVELACGEDDGACPGAPYLSDRCLQGLTPGAEYYVQVAAWSSGDRGLYTLEVQSPCPPPSPVAEPATSPRNRTLALTVPPFSTATGEAKGESALRVRLVDLQNPMPPNALQFPPPDFSAFEAGVTCNDPSACVRWVGRPLEYLDRSGNQNGVPFRAARLQCTPHYHNWSDEGVFHIVGAEIMPSSTYDVQNASTECIGSEINCPVVSSPLRMTTGRFGDVAVPLNPPSNSVQPDGLDITAMVNKFKGLPGASPKTATQLQPNAPDPTAAIDALDIVACLDAFKGFAYPFSGPCPCPSLVTCDATPCNSASQCPGGTCVHACTGGERDGNPCMDASHCPGGACGPGFCRDSCARCSPPE